MRCCGSPIHEVLCVFTLCSHLESSVTESGVKLTDADRRVADRLRGYNLLHADYVAMKAEVHDVGVKSAEMQKRSVCMAWCLASCTSLGPDLLYMPYHMSAASALHSQISMKKSVVFALGLLAVRPCTIFASNGCHKTH